MNCFTNKDAIKIFKGDDTDFNYGNFITFKFNSELDLSTFTGVFQLGIFKQVQNLTENEMVVNIPHYITSQFLIGNMNGIFRLIDNMGRVATVTNTIPFVVTQTPFTPEDTTVELEVPEGYPVTIQLEIRVQNGDYNLLTNKPSINGVTLTGNKTGEDLGLADQSDISALAIVIERKQDAIPDLNEIRAGAFAGATAVQPADLQTELANKQDTLVSGTNIKTVNNNSLVGSGNIDIESLPSQTGQSGKFLTTDGTNASWGTPPKGLQNTATGTDSLTLLGTATASTNAINIGTGSQTSGRRGVALGYRALASAQDAVAIGPGSESVTSVRTQATAQNAVAIGGNAIASGERSVALGFNAGVSNTNTYGGIALGTGARIDDGGTGAIQIGTGHNGTPYTLSIGLGSNNYLLLQANGKIPAARLPSMAPTLTWYTGNTGTTVTIANTSSAALVKVYKNGVLLQPTQDYSISGTTLTLVTALVSTDKITTEVF